MTITDSQEMLSEYKVMLAQRWQRKQYEEISCSDTKTDTEGRERTGETSQVSPQAEQLDQPEKTECRQGWRSRTAHDQWEMRHKQAGKAWQLLASRRQYSGPC